MSGQIPLTSRQKVGEVAPKFLELGDEVLYGDIWERPQLSKRDRSLITCAAVVAGGWTEQMKTHFPKAIQNGVTKEELIELITHMAFYSGWPSASTAVLAAREIFAGSKS
jgi:4-carboxymuconolactone decarboxylase